jgi:hypothetical protein
MYGSIYGTAPSGCRGGCCPEPRWVCRRCQYAVVPKEIPAHLQAFHRDVEGLTSKEIRQCTEALLAEPADPPETTQQLQRLPNAPPIPFLALFHNGFACRLCPSAKPYICQAEQSLTKRLRQVHQWSRPRGHQTAA